MLRRKKGVKRVSNGDSVQIFYAWNPI